MDERMRQQEKAFKIKQNMMNGIYRHFKGNFYVVLDVVVHSETAELLVAYFSYANPENVWVRPYEMFISEVDHEKYPDVKQKMRFEKVGVLK